MSLRHGEVLLIKVRFHQADGEKVGPVVVVLDSGDNDFVGAPITSRAARSEFDVAISEWAAARLNVPSWIRVDKVAVLAKVSIVRRLGNLIKLDQESLRSTLCKAYCYSAQGS